MTQFSKKRGVQFLGKFFLRAIFGGGGPKSGVKKISTPPTKFFFWTPLKKKILEKNYEKKISKKNFEKKILKKIFGKKNLEKIFLENFFLEIFFLDKLCNSFKFVSVLLSASVERVGVSRMRDFYKSSSEGATYKKV